MASVQFVALQLRRVMLSDEELRERVVILRAIASEWDESMDDAMLELIAVRFDDAWERMMITKGAPGMLRRLGVRVTYANLLAYLDG